MCAWFYSQRTKRRVLKTHFVIRLHTFSWNFMHRTQNVVTRYLSIYTLVSFVLMNHHKVSRMSRICWHNSTTLPHNQIKAQALRFYLRYNLLYHPLCHYLSFSAKLRNGETLAWNWIQLDLTFFIICVLFCIENVRLGAALVNSLISGRL